MKFLVLPGDGIGPEIIESAVAVLKEVDQKHGLGIEYDYQEIGFASLEKYGTTLRHELLESART